MVNSTKFVYSGASTKSKCPDAAMREFHGVQPLGVLTVLTRSGSESKRIRSFKCYTFTTVGRFPLTSWTSTVVALHHDTLQKLIWLFGENCQFKCLFEVSGEVCVVGFKFCIPKSNILRWSCSKNEKLKMIHKHVLRNNLDAFLIPRPTRIMATHPGKWLMTRATYSTNRCPINSHRKSLTCCPFSPAIPAPPSSKGRAELFELHLWWLFVKSRIWAPKVKVPSTSDSAWSCWPAPIYKWSHKEEKDGKSNEHSLTYW